MNKRDFIARLYTAHYRTGIDTFDFQSKCEASWDAYIGANPEKPKKSRAKGVNTFDALSKEQQDFITRLGKLWRNGNSEAQRTVRSKVAEVVAQINPDDETRKAIYWGAEKYLKSLQGDYTYCAGLQRWLGDRRWEDWEAEDERPEFNHERQKLLQELQGYQQLNDMSPSEDLQRQINEIREKLRRG